MHKNLLFHTSLELLNQGLSERPATDEIYQKTFRHMAETGQIVIHGDCICLAENERNEKDCADRLIHLVQTAVSEKETHKYAKAFEKICSHSSIPFSNDQKHAVLCVLSHRISLLTGGPGTGKTTVLRAVIETYRKVHGEEAYVTLLAPTGKAAVRMHEATGLPANTIH